MRMRLVNGWELEMRSIPNQYSNGELVPATNPLYHQYLEFYNGDELVDRISGEVEAQRRFLYKNNELVNVVVEAEVHWYIKKGEECEEVVEQLHLSSIDELFRAISKNSSVVKQVFAIAA